jgi:succinyl-diaminopimelate desuccinylase
VTCYPGNYGVVVGARDFYHGISGHSGGRKLASHNAIEKAAQLVQALGTEASITDQRTFTLAPSLTITRIAGGASFSMIPDRCEINVDMRLTPQFDAENARAMLQATAEQVDAVHPTGRPTSVRDAESSPAYRLSGRAPVVEAMLAAARTHHDPQITTTVCGPSNVGDYFAAHQIAATCGFGVTYENLHAPNECIKVGTIEMTHKVYYTAVRSLLTLTAALHNA